MQQLFIIVMMKLTIVHLLICGVVMDVLILYIYIWLRGTFPRYRYDQLMRLGWKWLLPLTLANILLTGLTLLLMRPAAG